MEVCSKICLHRQLCQDGVGMCKGCAAGPDCTVGLHRVLEKIKLCFPLLNRSWKRLEQRRDWSSVSWAGKIRWIQAFSAVLFLPVWGSSQLIMASSLQCKLCLSQVGSLGTCFSKPKNVKPKLTQTWDSEASWCPDSCAVGDTWGFVALVCPWVLWLSGFPVFTRTEFWPTTTYSEWTL